MNCLCVNAGFSWFSIGEACMLLSGRAVQAPYAHSYWSVDAMALFAPEMAPREQAVRDSTRILPICRMRCVVGVSMQSWDFSGQGVGKRLLEL